MLGVSWPGNGVVGAGVGFSDLETASSSCTVESGIFLNETELD